MASIHRYRTTKGDVRYDVRWRDGSGRQRSRAFSRRKDAERFRVEQDRARQLGQLYDAPPIRFGDFLAGWLVRHERRVRPSTFERESQSLRRFHVLFRWPAAACRGGGRFALLRPGSNAGAAGLEERPEHPRVDA